MSCAPVHIMRSYDIRSNDQESRAVINWDNSWNQMLLDRMIKRNSPDDFDTSWRPAGTYDASGRNADELFGCSGTDH